MNLARILLILIGLAMTTSASFASPTEKPYQAEIQYALEHLVSGTSTESQVRGTALYLKPVRTWKSVSGHWCRRYEIRIADPEGEPFEGERTRCRVDPGVWLPVAEK